MAKLRSVTMVNYRRFAGEIELPLDPGITLIEIPPGGGKSTVLEAIAWCLLGEGEPEQIPNASVLEVGRAEVAVALTFVHGERLERRALFSRVDDAVHEDQWGWALTDGKGRVIEEGTDRRDLADHVQRLFPEECVHSNLISGASLTSAARGGRSGPEKAVECSDIWCTSDLPLRASYQATDMFLRMRPDAPVNTLGYDPEGRLDVSVEESLTPDEVAAAVLCHALAYAKENGSVCSVLIEDPMHAMRESDPFPVFAETVASFPSQQLVFLLSRAEDLAAVRVTGRVRRELEIRG